MMLLFEEKDNVLCDLTEFGMFSNFNYCTEVRFTYFCLVKKILGFLSTVMINLINI